MRSIAYTNAIATRPTLPPLPARVLPNASLLVPFLFSRPQGLLRELCMHPPPLGVFMLQWSPELEDPRSIREDYRFPRRPYASR